MAEETQRNQYYAKGLPVCSAEQRLCPKDLKARTALPTAFAYCAESFKTSAS